MNFSLGGNAKSGTDFTPVDTSVTIPAGSRRAAVAITSLRNGGKSRTLTLSVEDGDGYRPGVLETASVTLR